MIRQCSDCPPRSGSNRGRLDTQTARELATMLADGQRLSGALLRRARKVAREMRMHDAQP